MENELAQCPHCKAKVRADRIEAHLQRVHKSVAATKDKLTRKLPKKKSVKSVRRNSPVTRAFLEDKSIPEWDFD